MYNFISFFSPSYAKYLAEHNLSRALFDIFRSELSEISYQQAIALLNAAPETNIHLSYKDTIRSKQYSLLEVLLKDKNTNLYDVTEEKLSLIQRLLEKDNKEQNPFEKKEILEKIILRIFFSMHHTSDKSTKLSELKQLFIDEYFDRYPRSLPPTDLTLSEKKYSKQKFYNFPNTERWRLLVDAKLQRQERAWIDYELREPGSMKSMNKAFNYMIDTLNRPLNVRLLKSFHDLVTLDVSNLEDYYNSSLSARSHIQQCGGSGFGVFFDKEKGNLTLAGLVEIDSNSGIDYHFDGARITSPRLYSEGIEIKMAAKLDDYQRKLKEISSPLEKLSTIVALVTNLERIHPFPDANCRTFCILLLNRELIRNQFSPVILEDPNRFDGYSNSEMIQEVIEGMVRFNSVLEGNIVN